MASSTSSTFCGIKGTVSEKGQYLQFDSDALLLKITKTDIVSHKVKKRRNEDEWEFKIKHLNCSWSWSFFTKTQITEKTIDNLLMFRGKKKTHFSQNWI